MPNWAIGSVSVSGTKENISKFISRFIYDDEVGTKDASVNKFFARSFINQSKQLTEDEIDDLFKDIIIGDTGTYFFTVMFAWSGATCLIDGYALKDNECITIMDACKEDKVSVEMEIEESGNAFEETISCDENGEYIYECEDMKIYKCKSCGYTEGIPSFYILEDFECCECGGRSWTEYKEVIENE